MKHVFSVLSVTCIALFTILLSTTNSGCKKGDDGAKGDTGTANVIYSAWLDVDYTPYTDSNGDTAIWYATISAPKLTKKILDSGTVKAYINIGSSSDPYVFPLPLTDLYALTGIYQLGMYFTVGNIELYCDVDAGTYTSSSQKYAQYRYVIIPGGVSTGRSVVNWNDYEAVKKYYNIPD